MSRLLLAVCLAAFGLPAVAGAEDATEEAAARFGLSLSEEAPTSIRSQELEAEQGPDGGERVVFRGEVVVEQGTLRIFCDRLEATYAKGGEGSPERMVCSGQVRLVQGEREASCTEAIFESRKNRAVCRSSDGPATLRRGESLVEGKEIVFDLARSTVKVTGGAVVRVAPRQEVRR